MGFADEVKQDNARRSNPAPAAPVVTAPELATPAETTKPVLDVAAMDFNTVSLPAGQKPVDAKTAASEVPAKAESKIDPIPEVPKAKIVIAGKEFNGIEEAKLYAEQLIMAREQEEAYAKGYEKANEDKKPKKDEKSFEEMIEEKLFESPKEAVKALKERIEADIFARYDKSRAEEAKQAQQQQASQKLWGDFYEKNADLSDPDTRDYIQNHLLKKHWDSIKDLPTDKSLPQLADMARKALRIKKDDALPSTVLSSAPAVVPGASNNATSAMPAATEAEIVDFVSQVNKLRRRSAK